MRRSPGVYLQDRPRAGAGKRPFVICRDSFLAGCRTGFVRLATKNIPLWPGLARAYFAGIVLPTLYIYHQPNQYQESGMCQASAKP